MATTSQCSSDFLAQMLQQKTINTPRYSLPVGMQTPEVKPTKKEGGMFSGVKSYVDKHKDIIFTLGLVILVDHFLFKGALKNRIQASIEGVLGKIEKGITDGTKA